MKLPLLILFVILAIGAKAQPGSYSKLPLFGYELRVKAPKALAYPTGCGKPIFVLPFTNDSTIAMVYYDSCNDINYYYKPQVNQWDTLGGGGLQDYWSLYGNTGTNEGITDYLGTGDQKKMIVKTYGTTRFSVPANGMKDYLGTSAKLLAIDTTDGDRELVYLPAPTPGWSLTGDAGTNPPINFVGTTDNKDLVFKRNNLIAGYLGGFNTSFGVNSMGYSISGLENTAFGQAALQGLTTGGQNVGVGNSSISFATTANNTTGIGANSGETLVTGNYNSFIGSGSNTDAPNSTNRTAVGAFAYVTQNNSMVLGSISGVNGGSADTKVGIGVTAPLARLHVNGDARFKDSIHLYDGSTTRAQLYSFNENGVPALGFNDIANNYRMYIQAGDKYLETMADGLFVRNTEGNNTVLSVNGSVTQTAPLMEVIQGATTYMKIENDGKVGINTSPTARLHVNGDVYVNNTSYPNGFGMITDNGLAWIGDRNGSLNSIYAELNDVQKTASISADTLKIFALKKTTNAADSMVTFDPVSHRISYRTIPTSGGGVTTLSAIGSSPNANGATITGSTLNLEPASASFGGVVTTGSQTFAGAKTFSAPLTITGSGLIGSFGNTNSASWTHIGTLGSSGVNAIYGGYSNTAYFGNNVYYNGSTFINPDPTQANSMFLLQSGNFTVYNGAAGSGLGAQSFTVEQNGNIAIGAIIAGYKFDVNGDIRGRANGYFATSVGVGTISVAASAKLEVSSTTQGFLPPRMTTTQRNAISSPAEGLMIFNSTTKKYNFYNGTVWEEVQSF